MVAEHVMCLAPNSLRIHPELLVELSFAEVPGDERLRRARLTVIPVTGVAIAVTG